MSTPWIGAPSSSVSVAGAGSGRRPCAASTKPRPTGSGEQMTRSTSSDSSASATPTTSPIASTAPTSWKCTCSGAMPWMRPSAIASFSKAALRPLACALRQLRRVDLVADRRPVPVRLAGRADDGHGGRVDPVAVGLAELDAAGPRSPGRAARPSRPRRSARRAACRPRRRRCSRCRGRASRPSRFHTYFRDHDDSLRAPRAIRAAIVPAPKPSSMLTTATPAAHEVIIASSALTPPKVAP